MFYKIKEKEHLNSSHEVTMFIYKEWIKFIDAYHIEFLKKIREKNSSFWKSQAQNATDFPINKRNKQNLWYKNNDISPE